MTRRAYRITGRVQGVGFRWFVRKTAAGMNLRGTVRNAAEGHVEVVAEGADDALAALESALRRGPSTAKVDDVIGLPAPDGILPDSFDIIH